MVPVLTMWLSTLVMTWMTAHSTNKIKSGTF